MLDSMPTTASPAQHNLQMLDVLENRSKMHAGSKHPAENETLLHTQLGMGLSNTTRNTATHLNHGPPKAANTRQISFSNPKKKKCCKTISLPDSRRPAIHTNIHPMALLHTTTSWQPANYRRQKKKIQSSS
jgi:hypothetical protein